METEKALAPNERVSHGYVLWGKVDPSRNVYTLGMGKIFVLVKGSDNPCVIKGSKVEQAADSSGSCCLIKNDKDEIVGRFAWDVVAGWWKGDD